MADLYTYNIHSNKINVPKDIFISYSSDDKEYVYPIVDKLIEDGYDCWIDRNDIRRAGQYNEEIFLAIDQCLIFLAFMSCSYAEKPYCQREYNNAIAKSKNIMLVCLDKITEEMLGEKAYMLEYCAGQDIIGYHNGTICMDFDTVYSEIKNSVPIQYIEQNRQNENTKFPYIQVSQYIMNNLKTHLEKQYNQDGDYLQLDAINPELFPALKEIIKEDSQYPEMEDDPQNSNDTDTDDSIKSILYMDSTKTHVSLVEYLNHQKDTEDFSHILLIGEGGLGKTISLLETCRYLQNQHQYAAYIPLKNISSRITLDDYILKNICQGNVSQWKVLEAIMRLRLVKHPTMYLLLDGFNEIPASSMNEFLNNMLYSFLPGHPGTQVILTSRFDSRERFSILNDYFKPIEFCYLDVENIERYISSNKLPAIHDSKLLKLLRTPLMLTLYCKAETCKNEYERLFPKNCITFFDNPDSAGKILHNYFQTQIFRATKELSLNLTVHMILLEYILPRIGLNMILNDTFCLWENSCNTIFKEPTGSVRNRQGKPVEAVYFDWYVRNRLYTVSGSSSYTTDAVAQALHAVWEGLVFFRKKGTSVFFTHQLFRDYFAAVFISLEIRYLLDNSTYECSKHAALQARKLSDDILVLVADILGESKYEPYREGNIWVCHKKHELARLEEEDEKDFWCTEIVQDAQKSSVEQLLDIWRTRTDKKAQNAVFNIIQIMRLGRNGKLFSCDFSKLDLRGCSLKGIRFSEYLAGNYYSSSFDNAWIDKECFVQSGHSSIITAVSIPYKGEFFTGDIEGVLYRWSLSERIPLQKYPITKQMIHRLVYSTDGNILLILTKHELFSMDIAKQTTIKLSSTHKYYVDVRFNDNFDPEVTYDTAPLEWCRIGPGQLHVNPYDISTPNFLNTPLISGCVRVSPDKMTCVYSDLYGQIRTANIDNQNHIIQEIYPIQNLKNYIKGTRITDICWHPSGTRVIAAYSRGVFEFIYSPESGLTFDKHIILRDTVNAICYTHDDSIIVCHGIYITLFKSDFSVQREYPGNYLPKILGISQRDNWTYLLSKNGELKLLDNDLTVHSVRNLKYGIRSFCFAHDLTDATDFICVLGVTENDEEYCERYDYETDSYTPLNVNYELEFEMEDHTDKPYMHYKKRNKMISIHRHMLMRKEYENSQGIYIQNCSFKNVQGTINDPENLSMIRKNGGMIDG